MYPNKEATGRLAQLSRQCCRCGRSRVRIPSWSNRTKVSSTARHRGDVSSELCCPGAKPRKWAPPIVSRLGLIQRVW